VHADSRDAEDGKTMDAGGLLMFVELDRHGRRSRSQ